MGHLEHLGAKYKNLGHAKTKAYTGGAGAARSRTAVTDRKAAEKAAAGKAARGGRTQPEHDTAVKAHKAKYGKKHALVLKAHGIKKNGK